MLEKLKNLKIFKTSFVIDDKTIFSGIPTNNQIIDSINKNLLNAEIIESQDKVIFKYNEKKYECLVRWSRGGYYISAREI